MSEKFIKVLTEAKEPEKTQVIEKVKINVNLKVDNIYFKNLATSKNGYSFVVGIFSDTIKEQKRHQAKNVDSEGMQQLKK